MVRGSINVIDVKGYLNPLMPYQKDGLKIIVALIMDFGLTTIVEPALSSNDLTFGRQITTTRAYYY